MHSIGFTKSITRAGSIATLLAIWFSVQTQMGCAPEAGGQIAMKIHYTQSQNGLLRSGNGSGEAPPDITDYRLCLSTQTENKYKCESFNRADNPSDAKMTGLDAGRNLTLLFQGYDSANNYEVRWCGKLPGITVQNGKTTKVSMVISTCSGLSRTRDEMDQNRAYHTATVLPNGRVLLVGGFTTLGLAQGCAGGSCHYLTATKSIEFYDPITGLFEQRSDLQLEHARALHTTTLLNNNKVLIAGGISKGLLQVSFAGDAKPPVQADPDQLIANTSVGSTAEVLDLDTMSLSTISLPDPRSNHVALLFPDDKVVLVGGMDPNNQSLQSIVSYEAGSFSTESTSLRAKRQAMTVSEHDNYSFTLWGGNPAVGQNAPGFFSEIIYSAQGSPFQIDPLFVSANSGLGLPTYYSASAKLKKNRILICGGMLVDKTYDNSLVNRIEILDDYRVLDLTVQLESFVKSANMNSRRALHTATKLSLSNNKILVAGGFQFFTTSYTVTDSIEIFNPETMEFEVPTIDSLSVTLTQKRAGHASCELNDGTVLLSGGFTTDSQLEISKTAEVYNPATRQLRLD